MLAAGLTPVPPPVLLFDDGCPAVALPVLGDIGGDAGQRAAALLAVVVDEVWLVDGGAVVGWCASLALCCHGHQVVAILTMAAGLGKPKPGTVTVSGKIARIEGVGLRRLDKGKTDSSKRTVPLPEFAIAALAERRGRPFWGEQRMIFPSSAGTCRDPDNFDKQWRKVRNALDVPDVTSHSFRKSVATMIDDAGLSARIGAD